LDAHVPGVYDVSTIPDNQLLEMIRQHKWIDLLFENQEEWYDMIRYYKHGDLDITTIRPNIKSDKQLILPIPQSAKAGNNLLIENP
jgi:starch-binding outer membrane protein, SusD/RagB family